MTFHYQPGQDDVSRVRFHIGDTEQTGAKFQDEEITALIEETGHWKSAVIACIQNLIARLSVPDFQADWLRVDSSKAQAGYQSLLAEKRKAWGLGRVTAGSTHVYRTDSGMTEEPDWTGGRPGGGGEDFDPYALVGRD